jgi:predicted phage terminase large subunit-like protein
MVIDPKVRLRSIDEACRKNLFLFHCKFFSVMSPGKIISPAPYLDAMAHRFERVFRGEDRRLINAIPPRHGKSELSVSFAAWAWGHNPALKFMFVSYGLGLSLAQTEKFRRILEDPDYQRIFPGTKIQAGSNRNDLIANTAGGEWRPASVQSAVTGFGADYIIIDDLHKADEALTPALQDKAMLFYQNTLASRFDDPATGRVIVSMQRLAERDFIGRLLERGGWPYFCCPAIAVEDEVITLTRGKFWHRRKEDLLDPIRIPRAYLEERRLELGERGFGAQFQQNPITPDTGLFRWSWFGQYDVAPDRRQMDRVIQAWDIAASTSPDASYSVGMTWGRYDGQWYLLDVIRTRLLLPELCDRAFEWHRRWRADVLTIERASNGSALYDYARREKLPGLLRCPTPKGSKLDRLAGRSAQLAAGGYLLPRAAPWLTELRHELLAFPEGGYDDQVDALTQFLEFVFWNERWLATEYDDDGRKLHVVRSKLRRARSYQDADRRNGTED